MIPCSFLWRIQWTTLESHSSKQMMVYKQITFLYKKSNFSKLDFMMKIGSRTRPDRSRPRKTRKTDRKTRKYQNKSFKKRYFLQKKLLFKIDFSNFQKKQVLQKMTGGVERYFASEL